MEIVRQETISEHFQNTLTRLFLVKTHFLYNYFLINKVEVNERRFEVLMFKYVL